MVRTEPRAREAAAHAGREMEIGEQVVRTEPRAREAAAQAGREMEIGEQLLARVFTAERQNEALSIHSPR